MTPEQLATIQARADAATEGPWEAKAEGGDGGWAAQYGVRSVEKGWSVVHAHVDWEGYGNGSRRQDAVFIAHARTDVPALLALVREQQARIERVREMHTFAHTDVEPWATSYRYSGDHCGFDGEHWPCATIAALTATEGA